MDRDDEGLTPTGAEEHLRAAQRAERRRDGLIDHAALGRTELVAGALIGVYVVAWGLLIGVPDQGAVQAILVVWVIATQCQVGLLARYGVRPRASRATTIGLALLVGAVMALFFFLIWNGVRIPVVAIVAVGGVVFLAIALDAFRHLRQGRGGGGARLAPPQSATRVDRLMTLAVGLVFGSSIAVLPYETVVILLGVTLLLLGVVFVAGSGALPSAAQCWGLPEWILLIASVLVICVLGPLSVLTTAVTPVVAAVAGALVAVGFAHSAYRGMRHA